MHIPDGFLDVKTVVSTYALSSAAGVASLSRVRKKLEDEKAPLLGVLAAFIFAAQMVNFPVLNGTSGHLIGGLLAALLVGPWAGFFVIASVLFVQAIGFQDGGIAAFGANVFNMAVIGTIGAYWIFVGVKRLTRSYWVSAAVAAWASVVLASVACALELWASGHVALDLVLPAMAGVHAVIGIGEAVITVGVVRAIAAVRPDVLPDFASVSPQEVAAHEA